MGICNSPGVFEYSTFHLQPRIVVAWFRLPYIPSLDHHLPVFPPVAPDPDSNNQGVEIYLARGMIENGYVLNFSANEMHIGLVTIKPRSGPPTEGSSFFESCFLRGEFQTQDF
jgi:hypothetical protein